VQQIVVVTAFCAVGACLGSFAATTGLRLARGEQSMFGRSRCDHCGVGLGYLRTVPVVSFTLARGVCVDCGGRIDAAHLAGEIVGVVIMVAALAIGSLVRSSLIVAMGLTLLASAVADAKTRRLPDSLTLAVAIFGLTLGALHSMETVWVGLATGAIAFVMLEFVRRGFIKLRGKEGLGFGDVKLISALAIWLGFATPWTIIVAALGALIASRFALGNDGKMAFGPAIAVASFTVGVVREVGGAPWMS
jgi:leader peptidase (prepilin peptidase)/N-methyltransferase